jgi:hypothetical protein
MPIVLSKPCLLLTAIARPDCFEFAMDFLGGTEEAEVRSYVEKLESIALAQPEPVPTDEELWAVGNDDFRANCYPTDAIRFARAVLARWGNA